MNGKEVPLPISFNHLDFSNVGPFLGNLVRLFK